MSSNPEQFNDERGPSDPLASENKGDDSDFGLRPGEDVDDAATELDDINSEEDTYSLGEFNDDDYMDHLLKRGNYTPEITESGIHPKSNETSFIPDSRIFEAFEKVNHDLETSSPESTVTLCIRHGISYDEYSQYAKYLDGNSAVYTQAVAQTEAAKKAMNEAVDEAASNEAMERVMREHGIK